MAGPAEQTEPGEGKKAEKRRLTDCERVVKVPSFQLLHQFHSLMEGSGLQLIQAPVFSLDNKFKI